MSNIKYTVMCRYEHWTLHGKTWTKWFKSNGARYYDTEQEAINHMKEAQENCKSIDKSTKLGREFQVEKIDIDLLPTPAPPPPPKPKRPRGRPKKNAE